MLLLQAVANFWDKLPEGIKGGIGALITLIFLVCVLAYFANPNRSFHTRNIPDPKDTDDPMEGKFW